MSLRHQSFYISQEAGGGITGTVGAGLAPLTSAESGAVKVSGAAAGQLAALAGALSGAVKIGATLHSLLAILSAGVAGKVNIQAGIVGTLPPVTAFLNEIEPVVGQLGIVLFLLRRRRR